MAKTELSQTLLSKIKIIHLSMNGKTYPTFD